MNYIVSLPPRTNSIINKTNSTILQDISWIINQKGILSGEIPFGNVAFSDAPDSSIKYGHILFWKHDDNYVTVELMPETTQNIFFRRFINNPSDYTKSSWGNNWWKTQLVEVT